MKIRNRITLWIAGAGVLASLLLSVIVLYEMMEQPYILIDRDLEDMARIVINLVEEVKNHPEAVVKKNLELQTQRYWIKIYDHRMNVVYQSKLAGYADLQLKRKKDPYVIEKIIPKKSIYLEQDRKNEVAFRIRNFNTQLSGKPCLVQIGKPVEKLEEEINDLIFGIGAGLAVIALLLIIASYFIAGKILKPIKIINQMAEEINDRSLDMRIPPGDSEGELYELAKELNRMFDRLQYSFDMQKQFIADAAHELKSPITLLQLSMEDSIQRKDIPESAKFRVIHQTDILRRMKRLVKNLLDLSELQMKKNISFTELDLFNTVKSVCDDYADLLAARDIFVDIIVPENLTIRCDKDSFHRALINLIDNAIKYNIDGGRIEIAAEKKDRQIFLSILNTGKNIPEKDIDLVFEQFYRVEKSRSLEHGGSGLGLTIVKKIIELHKGSISIESLPDSRTRVNIVLPATK